MNEDITIEQKSSQIPENKTVFNGPITLPDQSQLMEFMKKNVPNISGRSTGTGNPSIAGSYTAVKIAIVGGYATGITFDSTNNRFTCLTAGNYIVAANAAYVNTATAEEIDVMIYKNGSAYSTGFNYTPGNVQCGAVVTDIVQLAVGDYIELYTIHSGAARNLAGSSSTIAIAKI